MDEGRHTVAAASGETGRLIRVHFSFFICGGKNGHCGERRPGFTPVSVRAVEPPNEEGSRPALAGKLRHRHQI